MILMAAYENVLLQKLEKLFHHHELRFGIDDPSQITFPAIYPMNDDKNSTGFPVYAKNRISNLHPYLDRPSRFLFGPTKTGPIGTLSQTLFDKFFMTSDQGYGWKSFWTTDNGNQEVAPKRGLRFGQAMQWGKGKFDKLNDGLPHFQQLTEDIKPLLEEKLKSMFELSDVELHSFLEENGLKIPGEDDHKLSKKDGFVKVDSLYGNNISPNQRRLIAAWQLFLRHDLAVLLNHVTEKALAANKPDSETYKRGQLEILEVAKRWLVDVKDATSKICRAESPKDLAFLEEHPTAVAHHIMVNSDKVAEPKFLQSLDAFCNAGKVKPTDPKNMDRWLTKPWGITSRTQRENLAISGGTVLVVTGGVIAKASIPASWNPVGIAGQGIGWGVFATGSATAAIGAISKADHVLQKLMFDSALVNPALEKRQYHQAGAAWHAITSPLYMYGYFQMGRYIAKNGVVEFIVPPGGKLFSLLFSKNHPGYQAMRKDGLRGLLSWIKANPRLVSPRLRQFASTAKGSNMLKKEVMSVIAFSNGFTAIGITAQKFMEEGKNPVLESAFWVDTFQTYLGSNIFAKLLPGASSLGGYVKTITYVQLQTYVVDRFFQYSMGLASGDLPSDRYMEFSVNWEITKQWTTKPIGIGSYHILKRMAGRSVMGYVITMSLWDYVFYGYPILNALNSGIVDYLDNKDVGFFEVWKRLEFRDFHINNPKPAPVDPDVYEGKDIAAEGILNIDKDMFESMQFLNRYYNGDMVDKNADAIIKAKIEVMKKIQADNL